MNLMTGRPGTPLPVPRYVQVLGILRQRIVDRVYYEGEQLLPEDGLAKEFGVSRATIRQAVGELVRQGLVERVQGRGTFVLRSSGHLQGQRFCGSLGDLLAETKRTKVRDVKISRNVTIQPRIAEALNIDNRTATVVRRTRTMDDLAFALTMNYLPPRYANLLSAQELRKVGLMSLLESKGVKFLRANQSIRAEQADLSVAEALGLQFGSPVLFVERTLLTGDGPVQFVQSWYRGDVYEFSVTLDLQEGPGLLSQLALPASASDCKGSI
jgi:GntR family transcriptional regulator